MATTPDYTVNYEDERLTSVTDKRDEKLADSNALYSGMVDKADKYFNDQIQASKDWADKQTELQNERTDFTIEQIEQQKDQAHKDYIKEQSASYVDWQKQSNQYGVEAEKMASSGLTGTGYSESSQVSMYNTYQNRVATARESYNMAVMNYNNAIKDAQLQNNAAIAEIAYQALQQQLELSLQGFQYKNQLLIEQSNKQLEIENMYHNQWMDVLNQINTENALAEEVRQYNETMAWNTEQAKLDREFEAEQARLEREFKEAQAELDRKHEEDMLKAKTAAEKEILQKEHDLAIEKLNQQLTNEKELLAYEYSLRQTPITGDSDNSGNSEKTTKSPLSTVGTEVSGSDVSNQTVNAKSKMSLGEGPISDAKVADRVSNGTANAYSINGQIYVEPAVTLPTQRFTTQGLRKIITNANVKPSSTAKTNKTKTTQPYRFRGL